MDWFNNWIDKHFEKQGYKLVRCDKYGARYTKYVEKYNNNSAIPILQKNSGNHLVQCYDIKFYMPNLKMVLRQNWLIK